MNLQEVVDKAIKKIDAMTIDDFEREFGEMFKLHGCPLVRKELSDKNIYLPLIRNIIPNIIASDLVNVQPMCGSKSIGMEETIQNYEGWVVYSTDHEKFVKFDYVLKTITYEDEDQATIFTDGQELVSVGNLGERERETYLVIKASKTDVIEVPIYEEGESSTGEIFLMRHKHETERHVDFSQQWTWQQFEDFIE